MMTSRPVVAPRERLLAPSLRQPLDLPTNVPDISSLMNNLATKLSATAIRQPDPEAGELTCWLLDTRELWPGQRIWSAPGAAEAMALISMAEQKVISSKMFIQDAKMSLGSALLKRLFISKTLNIPWKDVRFARRGDAKHGKPGAVDAEGRHIEGIDFNVSHQAGLVSLIGWDGRKKNKRNSSGVPEKHTRPSKNVNPEVMVGTDIVCVNERDDYRTIDAEGLDGWVDIYDFVFSDEERWSMKYDVDYVTLRDGTVLKREDIGRHDRCITRTKQIALTTPAGRRVNFNSDRLVDAKLRRFYTFFCYKEAYVKLAGEALLAPWLKQLEFFNVRSPQPGESADPHDQWGEEVDDVEVHLKGREVSDVRMKIQSYEEDFMISTAIQGKIGNLKAFVFDSLGVQSVQALNYSDWSGTAREDLAKWKSGGAMRRSKCRRSPKGIVPTPASYMLRATGNKGYLGTLGISEARDTSIGMKPDFW